MEAGDQHYTRIDLIEAKNRITKKLGADKAEKYFNLIKRFFSKKLNKSDFRKLCIVAVGRENISLHNWFIRSIVKNATLSTTPPAKPRKLEFSANGYKISCLQSLCRDNLLPKSLRRRRTPTIHDKKCRDRPSPLGPHGKPQSVVCQEQQSTINVFSVEDKEEVDQTAVIPEIYTKSPLTAPFGVQIRADRTITILPSSSAPAETCYSRRELPDTRSLMMRLKQKLEAQGLDVSLDYANKLNIGLDMYLKKLIKPCLELPRSGAQNLPIMNGMMQQVRYVQRPITHTRVSTVDLRTAMGLNPTLLGENWPLHLEKMALHQDWRMGAGTSHFGRDSRGLFE